MSKNDGTHEPEVQPGSDPGLKLLSPANRYTGRLLGGGTFANPTFEKIYNIWVPGLIYFCKV